MSLPLARHVACRRHAFRDDLGPYRRDSTGRAAGRGGKGGGGVAAAGIRCCLSSGLTAQMQVPLIDDADPGFAGWTPAELHELFADGGTDLLLARQFVEPAVSAALVDLRLPTPCHGLAMFVPEGASGLIQGGGGKASPLDLLRRRADSIAAGFEERAAAVVREPAAAGRPALRMTLHGKPAFAWLEPVTLLVGLRNPNPTRAVALGAPLDPAYGALALMITGPDGRRRPFMPVVRLAAGGPGPVLAPAGAAQGRDQLVAELTLAYDRAGPPFAAPGRYRIEAMLADTTGTVVAVAGREIEVLRPQSPLEEKLGVEIYDHQAGLVLALGGSRSPRLADGMWALEDLVLHLPDSPAAGRIAMILAEGLARPMFRAEGGTLRLLARADRPHALALARLAEPLLRREPSAAPARLKLLGLMCRWLTEEGQHEASGELFVRMVGELRQDMPALLDLAGPPAAP